MKQPGADDRSSNPLLSRITLMLNRSLRSDEKTRYRLAELGDCTVAFKLRGADTAVIVDIRDTELSLSTNRAGEPDVRIEGGFADFVAMARTQRDGTALPAGKVEIQGDLATAQQIQSLIAEASIDWEEALAQWIGDIPARQFGRLLRGGFDWARRTGEALERDVGEYLLYELRLLPTQREIEQFVQDGADLAAGVERLQARAERIRRKRGA